MHSIRILMFQTSKQACVSCETGFLLHKALLQCAYAVRVNPRCLKPCHTVPNWQQCGLMRRLALKGLAQRVKTDPDSARTGSRERIEVQERPSYGCRGPATEEEIRRRNLGDSQGHRPGLADRLRCPHLSVPALQHPVGVDVSDADGWRLSFCI